MATANPKLGGAKRSSPELVQEEETAPSIKRQKLCKTDDLVCPISLELPWDPVTAEDGRVYDRANIEKHFRTNASDDLKSPITNEKMGKKLLPAIQHRNIIENMIEAGAIEGDVVDKWNEKVEQKREMEELIKKAEGGDGEAMYEVGSNYDFGSDGFEEDAELAFHWYKRAHKAGDVCGTASLADCYLQGIGTDECISRGFMLASAAAKDVGAYLLGMAPANGSNGMLVDKEEAIYWLEKATGDDAHHDTLSDNSKEKAKSKLAELKGEEAGNSDTAAETAAPTA